MWMPSCKRAPHAHTPRQALAPPRCAPTLVSRPTVGHGARGPRPNHARIGERAVAASVPAETSLALTHTRADHFAPHFEARALCLGPLNPLAAHASAPASLPSPTPHLEVRALCLGALGPLVAHASAPASLPSPTPHLEARALCLGALGPLAARQVHQVHLGHQVVVRLGQTQARRAAAAAAHALVLVVVLVARAAVARRPCTPSGGREIRSRMRSWGGGEGGRGGEWRRRASWPPADCGRAERSGLPGGVGGLTCGPRGVRGRVARDLPALLQRDCEDGVRPARPGRGRARADKDSSGGWADGDRTAVCSLCMPLAGAKHHL